MNGKLPSLLQVNLSCCFSLKKKTKKKTNKQKTYQFFNDTIFSYCDHVRVYNFKHNISILYEVKTV
jgi:hypothetical protein